MRQKKIPDPFFAHTKAHEDASPLEHVGYHVGRAQRDFLLGHMLDGVLDQRGCDGVGYRCHVKRGREVI